ncbi:hypothetical protein HDU78_006036 [Chytriomyces hyalinus]|nr:hypothetical protein HDU78_006036 [Chytriomyces hyalinus]
MSDYIMSFPFLREGEDSDELKITIGLRMALVDIFKFWKSVCSIENEAECFRNLWDKIFSIQPNGIKTTATETTMKESKARKLNSEDRGNVRGLQSDISWQSETKITLCWGEGKRGDSTDNPHEAASALLKSLKGAKDCIGSIITVKGHNVEMFSMTLLGTI